MKRAFVLLQILFLVFCVFVSTSHAVPKLISYQGVLNDKDGMPMSATVNMTFSIYDVGSGGTALWNETQSVEISDGLFNVKLGSVQQLSSIIFKEDILYLGIQVGADAEMIPRQQITSTAFAHIAEITAPPVGTIVPWATDLNPIIENEETTSVADDILIDDSVDFISASVKPQMSVGFALIDSNIYDTRNKQNEVFHLATTIELSSSPIEGAFVSHFKCDFSGYNTEAGWIKIVFFYTDGTQSSTTMGFQFNWGLKTFYNPNGNKHKQVWKIESWLKHPHYQDCYCEIRDQEVVFAKKIRIKSVDASNQLTLYQPFFKTNRNYHYTVYPTPALPDDWEACNGQTITDPESYYYNQTLPDLNVSATFSETSIPVIWIMKIKE